MFPATNGFTIADQHTGSELISKSENPKISKFWKNLKQYLPWLLAAGATPLASPCWPHSPPALLPFPVLISSPAALTSPPLSAQVRYRAPSRPHFSS